MRELGNLIDMDTPSPAQVWTSRNSNFWDVLNFRRSIYVQVENIDNITEHRVESVFHDTWFRIRTILREGNDERTG